MRVRGHAGSSSMPMDKSQCFMLSRLLLYMDRLLARYPNARLRDSGDCPLAGWA